MRLYYGSETFFTKPTYGKGKPNNDYGLGFYMTDSFALAKFWASKPKDGGYVLTFDLDMPGLKILNLNKRDEESVLVWISILVKHRFDYASREKYQSRIAWLEKKFPLDVENYDVVIGYRADDSYFSYSKAFVANELSFEVLTEAMRIGKLGLQYVAISRKVFDKLEFVSSERCPSSDQHALFQKATLEEFKRLKATDKETNTFIRDLVRKYGE